MGTYANTSFTGQYGHATITASPKAMRENAKLLRDKEKADLPMNADRSLRITLGITSILFTSLLAFPAYAINEGGKCDSVKFGNSLVMSNGKIHGGSFGSNQNYSGPLYLCDGGRWVYWKMAEPAAAKKQTVNVRPGQGCNKIGRVVESTNHGTLVCSYVRAGKIRALLWTQG